MKFSVDIEAIEKALQTKEGKKELKKYVEVMPITVTTPAKIKVNTKRVAVSNVEAIEVDEILVIEQQMEDEYKNEYKKLANKDNPKNNASKTAPSHFFPRKAR